MSEPMPAQPYRRADVDPDDPPQTVSQDPAVTYDSEPADENEV